jgi:hypothetical protein
MKASINSEIDINLAGFPVTIARLFSETVDNNNLARKIKARKRIVGMGKSVIPHMNKLLVSKEILIRKEAVKILEQIADRRSIPTFIELLNDNEFDIRWIAAEGLIKTGRSSIRPLLRAVQDGKSSLNLNEGVHHVLNKLLHENEKQKLESLIQSLDNHHSLGQIAPTEAAKALKTVFKGRTPDRNSIADKDTGIAPMNNPLQGN